MEYMSGYAAEIVQTHLTARADRSPGVRGDHGPTRPLAVGDEDAIDPPLHPHGSGATGGGTFRHNASRPWVQAALFTGGGAWAASGRRCGDTPCWVWGTSWRVRSHASRRRSNIASPALTLFTSSSRVSVSRRICPSTLLTLPSSSGRGWRRESRAGTMRPTYRPMGEKPWARSSLQGRSIRCVV